MENRKTVLISDLSEGKTSPRVIATDWQRIPYTCREFSGVMVMAHGTMSVPDICLDPKLTGWYRIYTGMLHTVGDEGADNLTGFALSGDRFPRYFEHYYQGNFDRAPLIAEAFWKAADMTGQSVRIIHPENGRPCLSNAAYLKFVPMSGEEVAEELADRADASHKKLIATHDMHAAFCKNPQTTEDLVAEIAPFAESDTSHLMLEYYFDAKDPAFTDWFFTSMDGYETFAGTGDRFFHTSRAGFVARGEDPYPAMAEYARSLGMKVGFAYRVNMFAAHPPWDIGFNAKIFRENPQWRCVDRDGSEIARLSFAFPEMAAVMFDLFRRMIRSGADGVHLLFCRGVPNMLYEKPLTDAFYAETGLNAFELDEEDERYIDFRCRYFTENFMVPLKQAIIDEAQKLGRKEKPFLSVHALADRRTNRFFAIDLEDWAARGLVELAVAYPSIMHAPDDFCYNKQQTVDLGFYAWLAEQYGLATAVDLLPRGVNPAEIVRRANEVYDAGIENICVWDTYSYPHRKAFWPVVRRLGHKKMLKDGSLLAPPMQFTEVLSMNGLKVDKYNPWWCL